MGLLRTGSKQAGDVALEIKYACITIFPAARIIFALNKLIRILIHSLP
jgi:hypothetical protein